MSSQHDQQNQNQNQQQTPTLETLTITLLPTTHLAHPPPFPTQPNPSTNAAISSLQLHPTLEAALHILNADLPSAHFLVRHMQAPPALEGMLLHSILHRCEGDFGNARAWLGDVGGGLMGVGEGDLVGFVYGEDGGREAGRLVDDVEGLRLRRGGGGGGGGGGDDSGLEEGEEEEGIEGRIRREMGRVIEWCRMKFGDGKWTDASSAWVRHGEDVRRMGEDMVIESGGDG